MSGVEGAEDRPEFEAIITPYRSLGPAGVRRLAGVLLLLSAGVSAVVWNLGAWPVLGFNGAEMGLALLLLRRNVRSCRACEHLRLTGTGLSIRNTDPAGRIIDRRLDAGWLQAVLEERAGRTPALLLVERGHKIEIGALLGEAEKRDLAEALRSALNRLRNPVFDNLQLREVNAPPAAPLT